MEDDDVAAAALRHNSELMRGIIFQFQRITTNRNRERNEGILQSCKYYITTRVGRVYGNARSLSLMLSTWEYYVTRGTVLIQLNLL